MALGYEFLAITDHSKSQVIANGLSAERLLKHVEAIHQAGKRLKGITLLAGCEVDILADGRLDFDDEILASSISSSPVRTFRSSRTRTRQPTALLRAIENPYVNVIGHPTGRLINRREGLPLDFARIFKAAADSGTALEINAGYPRLDLNDNHSRAAIEAGVMLSINTDAHSIEELPMVEYGIGVARRAWATSSNVINCLSATELLAFIQAKRK